MNSKIKTIDLFQKHGLRVLLLALSVLSASLAFSHDFEVDGIYYSRNGTNAIVTYRGDNASSYSNEYSGRVTIPETVTYNGTTYHVTRIGDDAFYKCTGLTTVDIPNSVTRFGIYSFAYCNSLTNVSMPESLIVIGSCAFQKCSGLTSIDIPNCVTIIGEGAFDGCNNLSEVIIPNSVTIIGNIAFRDCAKLTHVEIGNSVISIGNKAFSNCIRLNDLSIPNSVISIGLGAFDGTMWYEHKPSGMVYAGNVAYKYKGEISNGATITLRTGTVGIAGSAFSGCSGLTNINIPNSVKCIGVDAFKDTNWYNKQPDGLVYAGNVAYKYKGVMPDNSEITLKDGTMGIAGYAFDGCRALNSITIPNSVCCIESRAFYGCQGLTSIVIPDSVTLIRSYAFCGCGFTDIRIPNSVTSIEEGAFASCHNLTKITFGKAVKTIDVLAMSDCPLTRIVCLPDTPPVAMPQRHIDVFDYDAYENAELLVPYNSINQYKTADRWRRFSNINGFDPDAQATSISLNMSTLSLEKDETAQLIATIYPTNVINMDVSWSSSNNDVATVNKDGLVTAVSVGTATITVKTEDGSNLTAQCIVTVNQLATSISLSQTDVTIYTGNTLQLNATVSPSTTSNPSVTWASSNTSVATVSSTGVVTAKSTGNAIITVKTTDGTNLSAQCFVTVKQYATSISLNQTAATIYTGNTLQLNATVSPSTTSNPSVTWSSSNTSVATVSSTGVVTAKSIGNAVITARTADGSNLSATCNVTVKQLATSISLNKTSETLYMGNTLQLTATVSPSSTSDKSVSWSSSNTSVATVSSTGLVTPKSTGTATITVRTEDGSNLTAQCVVTVKQYATSISLSETDVSINTGNTLQLTATVLPSTTSNPSVTWSSSNTGVATVSSTGLVTAKSTGEAVITAKTADGSNLSASCNVTVKRLATSISLNKSSATLYLAQTVQLTATVSPSNATDKSVIWSSSDNSIATVTSNGLVTAIAPGEAVITATTADGSNLSATCIVTVKAYVTSLTLDQSEATILEGDTIMLTPTIQPSYATNQSLNWSSSNTSVVSVNNGVVAGRSGGEATVTARTTDGSNLNATCKVTVVPNFDISAPDLSHIRGSLNNKFDLTIDLSNRYEITGMQFDLQLPTDVTISKDGDGEFNIWLDDTRKSRNHTATASLIGGNSYRILVSSATANILKGHSGTVLHIMIEIPISHVSGNKQVKYSNIILSEPDETRHTLPTKYSMISYYYKEGDANADLGVDVADYVITGNYILQNSPENFWYDAANVDHNSTIDVNDLTGITNIALGRREGGILQMPAIQAPEDNQDLELTANPLVIQAGQTKTMNLSLEGLRSFAGFQMDIQLPKGIKLADASLADWNSDLSVAIAELPDGSIRLLASSFSLKDLAVNDAAFLKLTLTADDSFSGNDFITLDGIKFSERDMALHTIDGFSIHVGNDVSGLEQVYSVIRIYTDGTNIIIDSPESGTARIVTIAGIIQDREVQPGHNVIPMDNSGIYIVTLNGTTTKLRLK